MSLAVLSLAWFFTLFVLPYAVVIFAMLAVAVLMRTRPGKARRRAIRLARSMPIILWLAAFTLWIMFVAVNPLTIFVTAPGFASLSLAAMVIATRCRHDWGARIAAANLGMLFLTFAAAVLSMDVWGKRHATPVAALLGAVFLCLTIPAVIMAWLRPPRLCQPWECRKCGYTLFGLDTHCCPECGTAFDPLEVAIHAPPGAGELPPSFPVMAEDGDVND